MITIEINDDQISAALARLVGATDDMSGAMERIGAHLRDSTEDRVPTGRAPDGSAWAARSPVTLARYAKAGGSYGGILHRSGQLAGNIFHDSGPDFARIGSPEPYSAMMQFGGSKARFPHLWGDIPARPFLGLSDQDRTSVTDIVAEWLERAATGGVT